MKNLIIILFSISIFTIYSQEFDNVEWCPNGATWIYSSNEIGLGDTRHYRMYKYEKDTFAYNLNLKKINKFEFTVLLAPNGNKYRDAQNLYLTSYLFYNSNDSVFYINSSDNLEFLYTFSNNLGTSWLVNSTANSFFNNDTYPISCDSTYNIQEQVTINSTNNDTINNFIYQFTKLNSSFLEWEYGDIYKNIGPSKSFFATPLYTSNNSCNAFVDFIGYYKEKALISYYDDEREYEFNSNKEYAHFITTNINKKIHLSYLSIYPNPTSNFVNLKNIDKIENIVLIDTKGSIVRKIETKNFDKISLINLKKGIYYLSIQTKKNNLIKKIIKL